MEPAYPMHLTGRDLELLAALWGDFFDGQSFSDRDPKLRVSSIACGPCLEGLEPR
jgi:hypothetical protein